MSAVSAAGPTLPPQDLDAEQSVLGAMMLNENAVDVVTEIVRPNDFYRESHAVVYTAIQSLYGKNSPVDAITVGDELATLGKLDDVGGTPFIYALIDATQAVANVRRYAEIVHDLAVIRRLIGAGMEIAQLGYERQGTARRAGRQGRDDRLRRRAGPHAGRPDADQGPPGRGVRAHREAGGVGHRRDRRARAA